MSNINRVSCKSPMNNPYRKSPRCDYATTPTKFETRFEIESITKGTVINDDILLESGQHSPSISLQYQRRFVSPTKSVFTEISQDQPTLFDTWMQKFPFHAHYEILRLCKNKLEESRLLRTLKAHTMIDTREDLVSFCIDIHTLYGRSIEYHRLLDSKVPLRDFSYSGDLSTSSDHQIVTYRSPKLATNCRAFRKFGANRFFDLFVPNEVHISLLDRVFTKPLIIAGRNYRLLWADVTSSPQRYLLFAESGIDVDTFISIDDVSSFCYPASFNTGTTIKRKVKRMKLSFSETIPSGVLPEGSLMRTEDKYYKNMHGKKTIMTDGCGLISREGIDYLWKQYNIAKCSYQSRFDKERNSEVHDQCPYSSFQARIGSLKGMWVLDESLGEGIKMYYRDSQKKFNLPMKCSSIPGRVEYPEISFDNFYDTVEICKWSTKPNSNHLSIRLVQILEVRGVTIDYVLQCASKSIAWVDDIYKDKEKLIEYIKRESVAKSCMRKTPHLDDDDLLWNLARAGVSTSERYFAVLLQSSIKKKLDSIRIKASYPVKKSAYLHMIPDHYGILEGNEVYVPLSDDIKAIERIGEVIAIRYPAFVPSDLLKFKVLSRKELRLRCGLIPMRDVYGDFYENLQNCILMSTQLYKGYCVAEIMSGGDYDGDQAWISWEPELVGQVNGNCENILAGLAEEPDDQLFASKDDCGNLMDIVSYAYACREHRSRLGTICNRLDCAIDIYGFDHLISRTLASKGFVQVDSPSCKNGQLSHLIDPKKKPHWKRKIIDQEDEFIMDTGRSQEVYSERILGVVWNYLDAATQPIKVNFIPNQYIRRKVDDALVKDERKVRVLREEVDRVHQEYNKKCREQDDSSHSNEIDMEFWRNAWLDVRLVIIDTKKTEDDKLLAAALLYEAVEGKCIQNEIGRSNSPLDSEYNSKKYSLAWRVAHDYLTRIIADGDSDGFGAGIVISRSLARYC